MVRVGEGGIHLLGYGEAQPHTAAAWCSSRGMDAPGAEPSALFLAQDHSRGLVPAGLRPEQISV